MDAMLPVPYDRHVNDVVPPPANVNNRHQQMPHCLQVNHMRYRLRITPMLLIFLAITQSSEILTVRFDFIYICLLIGRLNHRKVLLLRLLSLILQWFVMLLLLRLCVWLTRLGRGVLIRARNLVNIFLFCICVLSSPD